jgi:hypothetical protein
MTFLNSIFLAALAAIVIPLLIHFLSRRRIKIIDFSSLKFLLQMQKSKLRWLKILELLLLIIRMLVIAFIALAFARPALTGKRSASHAPASIVILLDDSPSVERLSSSGTVFDDMKRGVEKISEMLQPNDEATLITLSNKQTIYGPYSNFERLRVELYQLQPQPGAPAFAEGLRKAAEILSSSHNLNREIYIISDFQTGPWWDFSPTVINPDYRYFAVKFLSDDHENVGITRIEFPPQLLAPGEEFEITTHIKNFSSKAIAGRLVELFIDGNKRAQTVIDLKPSGTNPVTFAVHSDTPGYHRGLFEIEDDDYSPDNRFYFNFEIPLTIAVLGIAESGSDLKILEYSLSRTATGYIRFKGIDVSAFSRENLASYDVVAINNISALPPAYFNSLDDFINGGGGLLIILGNKSNLESYRSFIETKAGLSASPKILADPERTSGSYFYLNDFDLSHPIFKIYSSQNPQAPEIPPLKLSMFFPLSGGIALAKLDDNRAVICESTLKKIMVMGYGLNRESSDISIHSFFVPFMIRTVEHLASKPSSGEEYFISGHSVTLSLPASTGVSTVKLSGLSDTPGDINTRTTPVDRVLEVSRGAYGTFVNVPSAGYPGFYVISDDADALAFFSVNHDSLESIPQNCDHDRLNEILGGDIVQIEGNADIKDKIMQAKFGFELWKYCLIAALSLLMVESILLRKAT